jgi:hypothetical protein
MLTLFVMLTLENFPARLERGMEIEPLSIIYFVTFRARGGAHRAERADRRRAALDGGGAHHPCPRRAAGPGQQPTEEEAELEARIAAIREALDELERDLLRQAGST